MKGSLIIVGFFMLGIICGVMHWLPDLNAYGNVSFWTLCALRILNRALCVLESTLRRLLFTLPDRTGSESFTLFFDTLACAVVAVLPAVSVELLRLR